MMDQLFKTQLEKKIFSSAMDEKDYHHDWNLNQIIIEEIEKLQKEVAALKEQVKQLTYHANPLQAIIDGFNTKSS